MPPLRIALALALALLAPSAGYAATLEVVPTEFSPRVGPVTVKLDLAAPRKIGVSLATMRGRHIGWISRPRLRSALTVRWSGRLRGELVEDGRYLVEVVQKRKNKKRKRLAAARVMVDGTAPQLAGLTVASEERAFAGDHALLTTISPNGDGFRDKAIVRFHLTEPAAVRLDVHRTRKALGEPLATIEARFSAGPHQLVWDPSGGVAPRTYLLRLTTVDELGNRRLYGTERPLQKGITPGPVVRVRGVDAGFGRRSYAPGERATLSIATDASRLTMQLFRAGPEAEPTFRNDEMKGVAVTAPAHIDWRHRHAPGGLRIPIGAWPSGLYFARLIALDGTVGFAPFIVRPQAPSATRVAVVLPTNTWQAYNFQDADGDGWGDTWYASDVIPSVDLGRPHLTRGVPYRFRSYDLAFLRWLDQTGKQVDYLSDEDLEGFASGEELAARYDLVVFPGHEEYVTAHVYDLVERYRDLGGNLMFLSANNFFWQVERDGQRIVRKALWRALGRPEARVIGSQYLANDDGSRQAPFVVTGAGSAPWAFEGTDLWDGDRFGAYGIEIDAMTPDSPPGTLVLAAIPDAFGPGRTAQMTYYESTAGAKVFAAGALNFGGSVLPVGRVRDPRITRLLENLWARLSVP
jgi:hypothetical protein